MTPMKPGFLTIALLVCAVLAMSAAFATAAPVNVLAFGDSYIRLQSPTTNFGTAATIRTINRTNTADPPDDNTTLEHAVISFDLSTFATTQGVSELESVVLQLGDAVGAAAGQSHDVYRLRRDFVETEVTWNEFSTGNAWQTPGGLGVDDAVLIATGVAAGNTSNPWAGGGLDVTEIANAWLANPDTDRLGFMIFSPVAAPNQIRTYGSRESTNGPGPGPVLAVVIPEPGSLLLISAGAALILSRRRGQCEVQRIFS